MAATATVWDGQTVLLAAPLFEHVLINKDKVPVLGDLPLMGRLFRSETSTKVKKRLLLFLTPTLVDPAGNRVHTPDKLPFDPHSIPPQ